MDEGSIKQAARELNLDESVVRMWLDQVADRAAMHYKNSATTTMSEAVTKGIDDVRRLMIELATMSSDRAKVAHRFITHLAYARGGGADV